MLTVHPFGSIASRMWDEQSAGPENPQDLNRYSYVNNNPITTTDPSGHCGGHRSKGGCKGGGAGGASAGRGGTSGGKSWSSTTTQGQGSRGGAKSAQPAAANNPAAEAAQAGATRRTVSPNTTLGNKVHYDELNGGKGQALPTELQMRYPDTEFQYARQGQKGPDVTVTGGKHPSTYPSSNWPAGHDHGDFKPNTPYQARNFYKEINSGKLPDDTVPLPYDPSTGRLRDDYYFGP